jgi:hypothetical protein
MALSLSSHVGDVWVGDDGIHAVEGDEVNVGNEPFDREEAVCDVHVNGMGQREDGLRAVTGQDLDNSSPPLRGENRRVGQDGGCGDRFVEVSEVGKAVSLVKYDRGTPGIEEARLVLPRISMLAYSST